MHLGTLFVDGPLCPFNHRVQIAAAELGVEIAVVSEPDIPSHVREANTSDEWPVFAPADGSDLIRDSNDIVNYLIERAGDVGKAYRCGPEIITELDTLVRCISKVIVAGKPPVQHEFRAKLEQSLERVEFVRAASDGPFLNGERFSQAEGHVVPFLYRLPFMVEIRDYSPSIFLDNDEFAAWVDRVVNRPSFRAVAPKRHLLRQFYATRAAYGKPMKVGRLHHSGFREMWNDVVERTSAVAANGDHDNSELQTARDLCYLLFRAVALHAKFENLILFPTLDAAKNDPTFTAEALDQHDHEEEEMNALLDHFDSALAEEPGSRYQTLTALATACKRLRKGQFHHFDFEESHFLPVLSDLDLEQHLEMLHGAYDMCVLERPHLIGVLTSYMPIENVLSLLDSLLHAVDPDSEQWRRLLSEMHRSLNAERWLRVVRRFEDVIPISLMVVPSEHRRRTIGEAARCLHATAPIERIEIPSAPPATGG
jgi:glutathione S-transferase